MASVRLLPIATERGLLEIFLDFEKRLWSSDRELTGSRDSCQSIAWRSPFNPKRSNAFTKS